MRRPDTLESFERKARLHAIGNGLEGLLPPSMLASFHELVAVGEGQVALENLCSNLMDESVRLAPDMASMLHRECQSLGVSERYWQAIHVEE